MHWIVHSPRLLLTSALCFKYQQISSFSVTFMTKIAATTRTLLAEKEHWNSLLNCSNRGVPEG